MSDDANVDIRIIGSRLLALESLAKNLIDSNFDATTPNMDTQGERELTDQKIAASEARTDAKFATLNGKLDLILSSVEGVRNEYRSVRINMWGVGLGLAALIIGMASYGSANWYNGTVLRDLIAHIAHVRPVSR